MSPHNFAKLKLCLLFNTPLGQRRYQRQENDESVDGPERIPNRQHSKKRTRVSY